MKTFKSEYDPTATISYDIQSNLFTKLDVVSNLVSFLLSRGLDAGPWKHRLLSTYREKGLSLELRGPICELLTKHPLNECDPALTKVVTEAFLVLLGLDSSPTSLTHEVLVKTALRPHLHFTYHLAKSLEALMSKQAALALWRDFVDWTTRQRPLGDPETRPAHMLSANSEWPAIFKGSFDMVEYEMSDGRAGVRVNRCKWNEALRECEDPDYAYSVACHYDFAAFQQANPNFRLTRKQTLTTGAPFCDFCIHDIRKHDPEDHPGTEFWEKL